MKKVTACIIFAFLCIAASAYAVDTAGAKPPDASGIYPGRTTKSYVKDRLGEPYLILKIDDKDCWFFKSGGSSDQVLGDEDTVLFVQLNDKGIVEDSYSIQESKIPYIKPKPLEQVLKERKDEAGKQEMREKNEADYGKPDYNIPDADGDTWYYNLSRSPAKINNGGKVNRRAVRFDNNGNFIREWITDELSYSEESSGQVSIRSQDAVTGTAGDPDASDVTADIRDADTAYKKGSALNDSRQCEKAIPYFKKALELKPDFAMAYAGLAFAYQNTDRRDLSIQNYKKFIELNPTCMPAYLSLSGQYMLKNDIYDAYQCLKTAQSYNQNDEAVNKAIKALDDKLSKMNETVKMKGSFKGAPPQ